MTLQEAMKKSPISQNTSSAHLGTPSLYRQLVKRSCLPPTRFTPVLQRARCWCIMRPRSLLECLLKGLEGSFRRRLAPHKYLCPNLKNSGRHQAIYPSYDHDPFAWGPEETFASALFCKSLGTIFNKGRAPRHPVLICPFFIVGRWWMQSYEY